MPLAVVKNIPIGFVKVEQFFVSNSSADEVDAWPEFLEASPSFLAGLCRVVSEGFSSAWLS
jgi:hypothetical protein